MTAPEPRPIVKPPMTAARLVTLFKDLPAIAPVKFRADIDAGQDQSIGGLTVTRRRPPDQV